VSAPETGRASEPRSGEPDWVEIFADRISEDLKQILQEDMDWTTSLPILERLNRLQEIEKRLREDSAVVRLFRKAS
jgi:hypothetical protein